MPASDRGRDGPIRVLVPDGEFSTLLEGAISYENQNAYGE